MSERVNKIIISKNNCKDPNEFYNHINDQINLLLECGYSCFISPMNDSRDVVNIEFCPLKEIKELNDMPIPQPCWLYQDELEYLATYQAQMIMDSAREAITMIQEGIKQEKEEEQKETKKKKDKDIDA